MGINGTNNCRVCAAPNVQPVLTLTGQPVLCNVLWSTREQALEAPKGDLRLGFCNNCGHIFNEAFDPTLVDYTVEYENSLHFSPHFQNYCSRLARRLADTYGIRAKTVLEIGCGKGDFLAALCKIGRNKGYGFDRSYSIEQASHPKDLDLTIFNEFYSDRHRDIKADLICCRHVLEHIDDPKDFLRGIRRTIGERRDTVLYFEVPNVLYILRDMGLWDLIYEHCSYFSIASLKYLFCMSGFTIGKIAEVYDGQFIGLDCYPDGENLDDAACATTIRDLAAHVSSFADRYRKKVNEWQIRLDQLRWEGKRTVVWGGGSKGVTFLNIFKSPVIEFMVDINPRKQGKYVSGTGQEIVTPWHLSEIKPDAVIIMNPVYKAEITAMLGKLGLDPEVMVS